MGGDDGYSGAPVAARYDDTSTAHADGTFALIVMARLVGMRLEHRWSDWDRSPFTSESRKHVSVWRKPG